MQPFGDNTYGPKVGGAVRPFFLGGERGPHLTQYVAWQGPRSTSIPSGILIHPAVLPSGPKIGGGCAPFGEGSWVPI